MSITISTSPQRTIVYECFSTHCIKPAYEPTGDYDLFAWVRKGYCTGTMSPTLAPAPYTGICMYNSCTNSESTVNCILGSLRCRCSGNDCTKHDVVTTCTDKDVDLWSSSTDYVTGDVVRIGDRRYKCREWPFYPWCRNGAYKPMGGENNGFWKMAWTLDGVCPP